MPVCKADELLEVVGLDGVAAGADLVADVAVKQRLIGWREFGGAERFFAEQSVNGAGVVGGLKLAVRIGPRVCRAACNVNRAGRDEREEHVLIHREIVLAFVELTSVDAEPVRETVALGHRLAVLPAPQCRAAAADCAEMASANRSSWAAAQSVALPILEWPMTATRLASTRSLVSR